MKPIEILQNLKLLSWDVLLIGWDRAWANRNDIIDYAIQLLIEDKDQGDNDIALIAAADCYSDEEFRNIVMSFLKKTGRLTQDSKECSTEVMDKWRLAYLIELEESNCSEENKIARLQEIYADFEYPSDMESCSIYSKDNIDPLIAMGDAIEKLRSKFAGN